MSCAEGDAACSRNAEPRPKPKRVRPPQFSYLKPELASGRAALEHLQNQLLALTQERQVLLARAGRAESGLRDADEALREALQSHCAVRSVGLAATRLQHQQLRFMTSLQQLPPPEEWQPSTVARLSPECIRYMLFHGGRDVAAAAQSPDPAMQAQVGIMLERGARFAKFVMVHCPNVWVNMKRCNLMTGETHVPHNLYARVAASLPLHTLPSGVFEHLRAGLAKYEASLSKALRRRRELQQQLAQVLPRTMDIGCLSRRLEAAPGIRAAVEPVLGRYHHQQQQQQQEEQHDQAQGLPRAEGAAAREELVSLCPGDSGPGSLDIMCQLEQLLDEMEGTVQTELQGAILIYRQVWDGPLRPFFAQLPAACLPYSLDMGQITQQVCQLVLAQSSSSDTRLS